MDDDDIETIMRLVSEHWARRLAEEDLAVLAVLPEWPAAPCPSAEGA